MDAHRTAAACCLLALGLFASGCACTSNGFLKCGLGCGGLACGGEVACCGDAACGDLCCGDACSTPSYAGQKWTDCHCEGPKLCPCTGPECCGCEPECACGPDCACAAGCGCDIGCGDAGCGDACGCADGCGGNLRYTLRHLGKCAGKLLAPICGCGGCDGELYWSEWHNDPPRCCDPCDGCGNWVGPPAGAYHAPYTHEYAP